MLKIVLAKVGVIYNHFQRIIMYKTLQITKIIFCCNIKEGMKKSSPLDILGKAGNLMLQG
jgi:hypothetical protein